MVVFGGFWLVFDSFLTALDGFSVVYCGIDRFVVVS